ncbi:MAG TPA: tetratricopeptide repeat protein [Pseudobdellovibrionaceae bacterium]|nr:tetratricopeptide repeat protein [Pseudobdellovibrionaceae bacterium]
MVKFGNIFAPLILFILAGCYQSPKSIFQEGVSLQKNQEFHKASEKFEQLIYKSEVDEFTLKAAKEGSQLNFFQIKNYKNALKFLRYIVLNSQNQEERLSAQKQIISIYFDHEQDYKNSIKEISKFIFLNEKNSNLVGQYRLDLAKSYMHLENLEQALAEINGILNDRPSEGLKFDALLLKGNIYLNKKNNLKSAEVFREMLDKHSEKAISENVPILLSVVLEDNNDFKGAIEVLKKYEAQMKNKEYLELRKKNLEERIRNAPGTKGFRK